MRADRSPLELIRASFLVYQELLSLNQAAVSHQKSLWVPGFPQHFRNSFIMTFAVNLRSLHDFLHQSPVTNQRLQEDDIIAEDFFRDPTVWRNARPPITALMKDAKRRSGKMIAHLTYGRAMADLSEEKHKWDFANMINDTNRGIEIFRSKVNPLMVTPELLDMELSKRVRADN